MSSHTQEVKDSPPIKISQLIQTIVCMFPCETMLQQRRVLRVCGWTRKQLEICCGMLLSLSCSPSPLTVSTKILHLSVLFFFFFTWPSQADRRQAGVQRDCTRFMTWHAELESGPNLQMIWFSMCVQAFTECACRCQAMLSELTTPYWR